jgi:acetyl-CoA carboxylase biotin carboxyl carrier protein
VSSSLDAIKRVVAAFERSDWTEIDVRVGDVRVHLATGAPSHATPVPPASPRPPAVAPAAAAVHDGASGSADATPPPAGAHVVVSPSPGIFWRSPEPGAPPFADVGQTIDAAATVCIVEVMKLMNHLKAGVSGTVVAVYGENGVAVEKGERLFAIVPDAAGPTS